MRYKELSHEGLRGGGGIVTCFGEGSVEILVSVVQLRGGWSAGDFLSFDLLGIEVQEGDQGLFLGFMRLLSS